MLDVLTANDLSPALVGGVVAALTAVFIFYQWFRQPKPTQPLVDLDRQSVEIEDGVHRCPLVNDPFSDESLLPDVRTLYQAFQRGLRISCDGNCLGWSRGPGLPYEWLSYQEVFRRVKNVGSGLLQLGLQSNPDNFLGIYSVNRIEWTLVEQACNSYSMVVVPLYDTLGPNASSFVINQAQLSIVVCDTAKRVYTLLEKAADIPSLKHIILMDDVSNSLVQQEAQGCGISVTSFKDVEPPKPSDLATICYTSGTTGDPKGVLLSHANIAANVNFIGKFDQLGFKISPEDVHISYLPLPHMFERCMQAIMFTDGGQIGFYRGDIKRLTEDIQDLKPTIFATVPRLLNRIYDKVIAGTKEGWIKSFIFNLALRRKLAELQRYIVRRDSIWDSLVFRKVQNILGGRIKCIITGAAPISPAVLNFTRSAFGCHVLEGYGQTEATAAITFTIPGDCGSGHVGGPTASFLLKLKDVPEMDHYASEGNGEICAKGPSIFQGYFKCPELTAEAFDEDGWLLTGDLGTWLPNGALKIIGRRKYIFKLAQGEYLSPIKIENIYARSQFVAHVFLHGNSLQPYPVAVVVPDPEELLAWGRQKGLHGDFKELCENEEAKNMILQGLTELGKAGGLRPYEQAKDILLHAEPFTVENDLLTPTFKNKRPILDKLFGDDFDRLYKKHTKSR